jgi:hypothetical protein
MRVIAEMLGEVERFMEGFKYRERQAEGNGL